ncbi:MAG: tetratricopeptide repeat protein [Candidatus Saccharicenans sp.]
MSEARRKDDYQKALALYGQAIKEFRKGNHETALARFKELLESYPQEYELVDRARVYITICERGQKRESISPRTIEDYLFYGQMRINQGDYQGALKLLEKALELKKEEAKVYYLMAIAYVQSGQVDEALEALKKAIQKDRSLAIMAQNESDFEPIWGDKRFKVLVTFS